MTQTIVVGVIVGIALLYLTVAAIKTLSGKGGGCGCGDNSCDV